MLEMYHKLSMRFKFNLIINIIVVIGLLMVMISSNMILSRQIETVILNKSIDEAEHIARHLSILLEKGATIEEIQSFTEDNVNTNEHIAYSVVINKEVEAIAHSDMQKIGTVYTDEYTVEGVAKGIPQTTKFFAELQDKWTYDIMVPVSIDGEVVATFDMGVYIDQVDAILKELKLLQGGQLIVFVIVLSIMLIIVCRKLFAVLETLRDTCEKIQKGDLSIELTETILERYDEVGAIGRALEALKNKIAEIMSTIGKEVETIGDITYKLQDDTESAKTDSSKMAEEISKVVAGSNEQLNYVTTSVAITKEIGLGIEQINQSIESVTGTTSETVAKTQEGHKVINNTIAEIKEASKTLDVVTEQMQMLGERSEQIQDITAMITGIAKQTNLLALNAAIEAARSGEHGKGFSVVADEVKALAEQSSEAAQKIEGIIGEVQKEIAEAIIQIEVSTGYVKNSTEAAYKAGETFKNILDDISRVSEEMQGVFGATEEVNAGSQHMLEDLGVTMEITKQLTSNIENIGEGATLQDEHMQEVLMITEKLGSMVNLLKDVLDGFKIK